MKLLNIDCMEYMAGLDDNAFDLAVIDPPYGLGISNKAYLGKTENDAIWSGRASGYRHTPKKWDNSIPGSDFFQMLRRVSVNQIIWGWTYFVRYFGTCPSYIVWDKQTSGNYSDCETAYCSFPGVNKMFRWLWNGYRKQSPEPILIRLLLIYHRHSTSALENQHFATAARFW